MQGRSALGLNLIYTCETCANLPLYGLLLKSVHVLTTEVSTCSAGATRQAGRVWVTPLLNIFSCQRTIRTLLPHWHPACTSTKLLTSLVLAQLEQAQQAVLVGLRQPAGFEAVILRQSSVAQVSFCFQPPSGHASAPALETPAESNSLPGQGLAPDVTNPAERDAMPAEDDKKGVLNRLRRFIRSLFLVADVAEVAEGSVCRKAAGSCMPGSYSAKPVAGRLRSGFSLLSPVCNPPL